MTREENHKKAIRIAKKFYGKDNRKPRTIQEIATSENLSVAQVNRHLKYAREHGIVEIKIKESVNKKKRNHNLEDAFITNFGLTDAIVVECNGSRPEADGYNFSSENRVRDDDIHKALGATLGEFLIGKIRDSDNIGVGGGRGPFYTIDTIREHQTEIPIPKKIQTTALSGSMQTETWNTDDKHISYLDPDSLALRLAQPFQAKPNRTFLPIAVATPKTKEDLLSQGSGLLLNHKRWERNIDNCVPNIAVVGIGSLAGGHRFVKPEEGFELEPIRQEISDLGRLSKEIASETQHLYYPVGDICNKLFLSDYSPRLKENIRKKIEKKVKKIKGLIDTVNDRIIAVSEDQLGMIKYVLAVAGGNSVKFNAIWTILMRPKLYKVSPLIHVLCTDSETAQSLNSEYFEYNKATY
ncbi:hypothetical protein KJ966_29650 [bacterium]|nr:hypothetical protein [bacterium]